MKILIAPNAFKGSLSADEAATYIRDGLVCAGLAGEFLLMPIADGGDGTLNAFLNQGGDILRADVLDPLGRQITAEYCVLSDGKTAVLEMARASGYASLVSHERNPMRTTSYGTGQLLSTAAKTACEKIILGVGGSATVDGGAGALQALGMKAFQADGEELPILTGGKLRDIAHIDLSRIAPIWQSKTLIIASDVDNPVLGENGAAAVFGPQKGATPEQVLALDSGLEHYFSLLESETGLTVRYEAGAGAAGAIAGGLMAALDGRLVSGVELLLQQNDFAAHLADADLVITGEGYMDEQTLGGKGPLGVARLAGEAGVPTVALVGGTNLDSDQARAAGIHQILPITPESMPLADALTRAPALLTAAARQLGKQLKRGATTLL